MEKKEILKLMYAFAHKANALVGLSEEDVRYLSDESEVRVLFSCSQVGRENRIDDMIREFDTVKEEIEKYQRYILLVEYNPEAELTFDELVRFANYLTAVVSLSKWALYTDDTIKGVKMLLVMSR